MWRSSHNERTPARTGTARYCQDLPGRLEHAVTQARAESGAKRFAPSATPCSRRTGGRNGLREVDTRQDAPRTRATDFRVDQDLRASPREDQPKGTFPNRPTGFSGSLFVI